jgi:hypothetical protein
MGKVTLQTGVDAQQPGYLQNDDKQSQAQKPVRGPVNAFGEP